VSDDTLRVELVAADRLVWSGEATVVNARTAGGEIGILANHMPVLSLLEAGVVEVETTDGETLLVAVDDGFLSVAGNRVSILASHAELAADIDLAGARSDLEQARGDGDEERQGAEVRRLEARVKAAEKAT
jgi:F-type H+-transporting ATPase subunit epsilon